MSPPLIQPQRGGLAAASALFFSRPRPQTCAVPAELAHAAEHDRHAAVAHQLRYLRRCCPSISTKVARRQVPPVREFKFPLPVARSCAIRPRRSLTAGGKWIRTIGSASRVVCASSRDPLRSRRLLRPVGYELRRLAPRTILREPLGFRSVSNGRQRRCRASLAGWGRTSTASPGIGPAMATRIASSVARACPPALVCSASAQADRPFRRQHPVAGRRDAAIEKPSL